MAKLVDASASGADTLTGVEVRVLFWAPRKVTFDIVIQITFPYLFVLASIPVLQVEQAHHILE